MHARIDTAARRRKLPVASHPTWTTIGNSRSGLKLGYRKGARGGVFVAKLISAGTRREVTLGPADDHHGSGGLSFADGVAACVSWAARERLRIETNIADEKSRVSRVSDVVAAYLKVRVARSARQGGDAKARLRKHVLSDAKLASTPVDRLTAKALSDWRAGLPETLSPAGVNRLFNDLRAALNAHIAAHWRDLPPTLSREIAAGLKALPDAQSARRALLSDSDVRRVVEAAYGIDADFGALVLVLASTGARFSQAARITVADFQPEAARVMVPSSLKGTSSKARRSAAVPLGADVVERLERLDCREKRSRDASRALGGAPRRQRLRLGARRSARLGATLTQCCEIGRRHFASRACLTSSLTH